MYTQIRHVSYYLPEGRYSNQEIQSSFAKLTSEMVFNKTGIKERAISAENQYTSDLAIEAGMKLLAESKIDKSDIDYLIVCTQSPDYLLPSTACIVHKALQLSTWCGTMDINQGCAGYIYSLGVAKALIESKQARNVVIINADTYTKYLSPTDYCTRTLFGDGAAATLLTNTNETDQLGPFLYGTDGSGIVNLISTKGGMRDKGVGDNYLHMNGPEVFNFTLNAVPNMVNKYLSEHHLNANDYDHIILHQASKLILDAIKQKLEIPHKKYLFHMENHGNTVSASIPITLSHYISNGRIKRGDKLLLVGFGVGYSFAVTSLHY